MTSMSSAQRVGADRASLAWSWRRRSGGHKRNVVEHTYGPFLCLFFVSSPMWLSFSPALEGHHGRWSLDTKTFGNNAFELNSV